MTRLAFGLLASSWTPALAASRCPAEFPWAYRPRNGFDYCCTTADDNEGHVVVNSGARDTRSQSCDSNHYTACQSAPCDDYWPAPTGGESATLQDGSILVEISTDIDNGAVFGTTTYLSHPSSQESLVATRPGTSWSASFVTANSSTAITLDSSSPARRSIVGTPAAVNLSLRWADLQVEGRSVNVTLSLRVSGGQLLHRLSFATADASMALWSWKLHPAGAVLVSSEASNFQNRGFGVVQSPPTSFSGSYPQLTMQYMASLGPASTRHANVYVAAHDPTAASKDFGCSVQGDQVNYFIAAVPPGAGEPFHKTPYTTDFDVVVAVFDGDWWDASQIYRAWALKSASWTQQGPMSKRKDVPAWLYNITTWVNSHWQGNDIFNVSGGDPVVVRNRVSAIQKRFGLEPNTLALHWYEWDTLGYALGSNYTVCETEVTCGFDTHYPEYFPVRDGFEASLKELQSLGVRVAPYINGRIFDKGTETWTKDQAARFASKNAVPTLLSPEHSTYEEQYGSQAKFAVMCPHTTYWQDTIADVVGELAETYKTDGVYIDQIAAAGPKACFDRTHNHSLGGGDHWVTGYAEMLRKVRAKAGNDKMLLTESNSEAFMGGINLFLTLVGFLTGSIPAVPSKTPSSLMVPAFQSIYGGYIFSVGGEFSQADFSNPDILASKVAVQYVFGAQMGWFSLGGRDNEHPDMGIYEQFMDSQYDAEVNYIRKLSAAKRRAGDWLNHGRSMRPMELSTNATADGVLLSGAWLSADGRQLLVTITTTKRNIPATASAMFDVARYGLTAEGRFGVWSLPLDGSAEHLLGTSESPVKIETSLAARDVALFRIAAVERDAVV